MYRVQYGMKVDVAMNSMDLIPRRAGICVLLKRTSDGMFSQKIVLFIFMPCNYCLNLYSNIVLYFILIISHFLPHRGWNYANCIETISKQISQSKNNEECWKMNTFCRDIFRGRQKLSLSKYSFSNQSFLILFASLSCVFVIMMLILRSTKSKKQQSHDEIEFTEVNSDVYQ